MRFIGFYCWFLCVAVFALTAFQNTAMSHDPFDSSQAVLSQLNPAAGDEHVLEHEVVADEDGRLSVEVFPVEVTDDVDVAEDVKDADEVSDPKSETRNYIDEMLKQHKTRKQAAAKVEPHQPVEVEIKAELPPEESMEEPAVEYDIEVRATAPELQYSSLRPIIKAEDVRVGVHKDKTRIVFDLSDVPRYSSALSEDKRSLLVTLAGTSWDAKKAETIKTKGSLIESYDVVVDGADTFVTVALKAPANLVGERALKPASGKGYRILFDVAE